MSETVFDAYEYTQELFAHLGFEVIEYVIDKDQLENAYINFAPTENIAVWILKMLQSESVSGNPSNLGIYQENRLFQPHPTEQGLTIDTKLSESESNDDRKDRIASIFSNISENPSDDEKLGIVKRHLGYIENTLNPSVWITKMLKMNYSWEDGSKIISIGPYDWYSHIEYDEIIHVRRSYEKILVMKDKDYKTPVCTNGPTICLINTNESLINIFSNVKYTDEIIHYDEAVGDTPLLDGVAGGVVTIYTSIPKNDSEELFINIALDDNTQILHNSDLLTIKYTSPTYSSSYDRTPVNRLVIPMSHVTQIAYSAAQ